MARKIAEVFIELNAETQGFQKDMDAAQRQLDRFSTFVAANPIAVVGALSAAFVGVAIEATKMADEMEASMQRIAAVLPTGAEGVGKIKDEVIALGIATGDSFASIRQAAEDLAKKGVAGPDEIVARLNAIVTAADATGSDMHGLVDGLTDTMRVFGLGASQTADAIGTIWAAAKGHASLDEVLEAIHRAAPGIQSLGLDLNTAAAALATLIASGMPLKQAAAMLKEYGDLGAAGAEQVKKLAAATQLSSNGFADLQKRQADVNATAEKTYDGMKNHFNAEMIKLGETILPTVNAELQGMIGIIERLDGTLTKIQANSAIATIATLSANASHLDAGGQGRLNSAILNVAGGSSSDWNLGGLTSSQLEAMRKSVADLKGQVGDFGKTADNVTVALGPFLKAIDDAIAKSALGAPLAAAGASGGKAGLPGGVSTPAQIKASEDASKAASELGLRIANLNQTVLGGRPAWEQMQGNIAAFGLEMDELEKKSPGSTSKIKAGFDQLQTTLQQLKDDEATKAFGDLTVKIAQASGDAVAVLTAQLNTEIDAREREAKGIADPDRKQAFEDLIAKYKKLQQGSIDLTGSLEKVEVGLRAISDSIASHKGDTQGLAEDFDNAEKKVLDLRTTLAGLVPGTKDYIATLAKLTAAEAVEKKASDDINDANKRKATALTDAQTLVKKEIQQSIELANGYGTVANSIIGAAQALGIMSASTAKTLQGIVNLSVAIKDISSLLSDTSSGFELGGWIGAIVGLIGSVVSIFTGVSAQNAQAKAAAEKLALTNNEALAKLTGAVGELTAALTGNDLDSSKKILGDFLNRQQDDPDTAKNFGSNDFTPAQLNMLQQAAQALGITLDGTIGGWRELDAALQASTGHLAQFGQDLSGKTALGNAANHFFGVTGTAALGNTLDPSIQASPILSSLFGGKGIAGFLGGGNGDPTKITATIQSIMGIFKQMQDGSISDADLGGLTGQQLLDTLTQLFDGLTSLGPPAETLAGDMTQLQNKFSIFGTDASDQLSQTLDKMSGFLPALKGLGDGLDLTSSGGIAEFEQRLKDLYTAAMNGGDGLDTGTMSLQDLMDAIMQLMTGAKTAADGIETAAQKISDAVTQLNQDFDVLGTPTPQQAQKIGAAEGFDLSKFDLSTTDGVNAAEAYLRDLYTKTDDPATKAAIQATIDAVYRIQPADAATGGAATDGAVGADASGGSSSASSSSIQNATITQADRLITGVQTLAAINQAELAELRRHTALLATRLGGLTPPSLPSSFVVGAGGQLIQIRFTVNMYFYGDVMGGVAGGQAMGNAAAGAIDRELGSRRRLFQQGQGNTGRSA